MQLKFETVEQAMNSRPRVLAVKVLLAISLASFPLAHTKAADAGNGERIAKDSCAVCHIVEASTARREVADAPPFAAIARKFNFNDNMLLFELLEMHPKMNFALTRREAGDVAAYMSTLGE